MAADGSFVAFQRCTANTCGVYVINTDGSGQRRVDDGCAQLPPRCTDNLVTHAGARTKVYSASFSPDGTAITLGMTGVNGQADVYTIGIDGTGLTPVTRSPAWDSAPDWGGTG
jgi:Tol biopolymer transport system component